MKKSLLMGLIVLTAVTAMAEGPIVVRSEQTWLVGTLNDVKTNWDGEAIRRDPYGFCKAQITQCNVLREKIEAQTITMIRLEKKAKRKVSEANGTITRYETFLAKAKESYKAASESGTWPVNINGFDLDEEELLDRIEDALERIDIAKQEITDNTAIARKVGIRLRTLKMRKREVESLRRKLQQQAEQVRMNAQLTEIEELQDALGLIADMMIDVDEDPTQLSVEDLTAEDPNAERNRRAKQFLNN